MVELKVGQVLALRIRYNNSGLIANRKHPYLIVGIDLELNTVEIAQIDSLEGKEYKAARRSNKIILCDNPIETVIDKDSYIQLDNTLKVELYSGLVQYRRQEDKLSTEKLDNVLNAYHTYHENHVILEDKQVYMSREEVEDLQRR